MENFETPETQPAKNNKATRIINIINVVVLLLMFAVCLIEEGGIISFFLGCAMGMGNFISMIIFITRKEPGAYISNIIWMLLMPIIGFGCCAATFELHGI